MQLGGVTLRGENCHLSMVEALAMQGDRYCSRIVPLLASAQIRTLIEHWACRSRPEQRAPKGDWATWLIMAGRGFGKTRAGAEWVQAHARVSGRFGRPSKKRIALVAATMDEARSVMVQGPSGLIAIAATGEVPHYEPSLRKLTWPSGAQAMLYSAAEPDGLRGAEFDYAWADEIAKWAGRGGITGYGTDARSGAEGAWDNLKMALRVGRCPQVVATTTPRPVPLVRRLLKQASETGSGVMLTTGTSFANRSNLPRAYLDGLQADYGGTRLGRQELMGEMVEDVAGALWTRARLDANRIVFDQALAVRRVVIGVDPPASSHGDACGIIVAAGLADGRAVIIEDASVERASPETWAHAVAMAAARHSAELVVAEANQGGDMVRAVLRAANGVLPIRLVHASRGKAARAEPVALLYEAGRVVHAGGFPELEDELCGIMAAGGYAGPGRSPDRADACVWALTELMLGARPTARVRVLG